MTFEDLKIYLEHNAVSISYLNYEVPFYPITDYEEVVPEHFLNQGWCEYNHRTSENEIVRVNIFNPKLLNL